jgi:hypothetical protein
LIHSDCFFLSIFILPNTPNGMGLNLPNWQTSDRSDAADIEQGVQGIPQAGISPFVGGISRRFP